MSEEELATKHDIKQTIKWLEHLEKRIDLLETLINKLLGV